MTIYNDKIAVGFDLGHGKTALTYVKADSNDAPEPLRIHGKEHQVTAFAYIDEKHLIGLAAINSRKPTHLEIAFKASPRRNPENTATIFSFCKAVYQILQDEGTIEQGKNYYFYVGCPSGWNNYDIGEYRKIFQQVGFSNVMIVKESRAALMHAIEGGLFSSKELKQPVLIIDLGSSTTDYTLVADLQDKPLDEGFDLGASLIDKEIFNYSFETQHSEEDKVKLRALFTQAPWLQQRIEFFCREVKEIYFNNPVKQPVDYMNFKIQQSKLFFSAYVDAQVMNEILDKASPKLGNLSWKEAFRNQLETIRNKCESDLVLPSAILLTGGASRMDCVLEICQQIFPELISSEKTKIHLDQSPELCIARGLARWGRVDIRTGQFQEDVTKWLDNNLSKIVNRRLPALKESLAVTFTEGALNIMKQRLRAWRRREIITLDGLAVDIERKLNVWAESVDAKKRGTTSIENWLDGVLKEVTDGLQPICRQFGVSLPFIRIGETNITGKKIEDVDIPLDITGLSSVIGYVMTLIIGIVIAIFTGVILFSGIIGWIIGIVVLVWAFGQSEEWVRKQDLYLWIRNMVSDEKINKEIGERQEEIKDKVLEKLNNDSNFKKQVIEPLEEWIREAVQKGIDKARLLIA